MTRTSSRSTRGGRQRVWVVAVLFFFAAILFPPAQTGNAQEPTRTQPPTESATLTAAETATETEPAAPQEEADAFVQPKELRQSGSTTRVLVTISQGARMFKAVERVMDYGDVIEMEELSKLGVFMMELPTENLEEHMEKIRNTTGILAVEPDYPVQATDTIPNDPGFANQYGLTAIRAPQGWDLATGSSSVTIAILDSGVDMGHGDLAGKLVAGYDFVNSDPIPQDDYGHGTHVAGIAAPTFTPFDAAQDKPASPTQTVPTPEASASLTPSATPTAMPPRENKMERLKILLSPYCCGSADMIFMGVWLFWREKKKKIKQSQQNCNEVLSAIACPTPACMVILFTNARRFLKHVWQA